MARPRDGTPGPTDEALGGLASRLLRGIEIDDLAAPGRDPHARNPRRRLGSAPARIALAAGADAAGPLSLALSKARLFEANRERLATLLALHETGVDLGSSRERDVLLRSIVERAQGLVHGTMAGLYLERPDGKLELVLANGVLAGSVGVLLRQRRGGRRHRRADRANRSSSTTTGPGRAGRPTSRRPGSAPSSACRSSGGGRASGSSS